jgi:hypothetical protein
VPETMAEAKSKSKYENQKAFGESGLNSLRSRLMEIVELVLNMPEARTESTNRINETPTA